MAASPGTSSGSGSLTRAAEAGCTPWAPASEAPPMADSGNVLSSLRSVMRTSSIAKLDRGEPDGCGAAHMCASWRNRERNDVPGLNHDVLADRAAISPDRVGQE